MMPIAVALMVYLVCCQAKLLYIEERSSAGTIDCGNLRVALQRAVYGANYEVTDQVKGLCEGKTECSNLDATNSFRPGDPCPGAGKAMWISLWCNLALEEVYYIPEGISEAITCQSTVFNINFAIYGIWTDVTDKVISECTPQPTKSSCVVSVPNNTWAGEDPCFGILKSLWISYDCVPWS